MCRKSLIDQETLEVQCGFCGKFFEPTQRQVRVRINSISDNPSRTVNQKFYCSDHCRKTCPIYGKSFEQLMKIDSGIDLDDTTSRPVQPALRKIVLERDNHTCVKCGKHQDELTNSLICHHIFPVIISPLESADVDNCITVCSECHKELHKLPGCTYSELRCNLEDRDEDTMNKIKKNKEIKKQAIDEDIEINISNEMLEDFLLD